MADNAGCMLKLREYAIQIILKITLMVYHDKNNIVLSDWFIHNTYFVRLLKHQLFPEWINCRVDIEEVFFQQYLHCIKFLISINNKFKKLLRNKGILNGILQYYKLRECSKISKKQIKEIQEYY